MLTARRPIAATRNFCDMFCPSRVPPRLNATDKRLSTRNTSRLYPHKMVQNLTRYFVTICTIAHAIVFFVSTQVEGLRDMQVMDVLRDDMGEALDPDRAFARLNASHPSSTSLPSHTLPATQSSFPSSTRSVIGSLPSFFPCLTFLHQRCGNSPPESNYNKLPPSHTSVNLDARSHENFAPRRVAVAGSGAHFATDPTKVARERPL